MSKRKWIDHRGQEVPAAYVPRLDKKKDRLAKRIMRNAERVNQKLAELKALIFDECESIKIEVNQSERIEFDDQITLAKAKLFEYLEEKLGEKDDDLRAIVQHAFETRNGQLDTHRILGLFRLQIKAQKWNESMELIKKSINRNNSRRYARVYRKDKGGDYKLVDLNFSSVTIIDK